MSMGLRTFIISSTLNQRGLSHKEKKMQIAANQSHENLVVSNNKVKITWEGWESLGKVRYTKGTAVRELINNVLVDKRFGRVVNVQLVLDTKRGLLWLSDDFVGFNEHHMAPTMDIGYSYKTPAILMEHGSGMKTAINWFGILEYIRTSTDGFDFFELKPDRSTNIASHSVQKSPDGIRIFDVAKDSWVMREETTGSQICIKLNQNQIPSMVKGGVTKWFQNLKTDLEKSYYKYLGRDGSLSVELIHIHDGNLQDSWRLKKQDILLSSPKYGKKEGYFHNGKLGPNKWDVDETYTCPITGIVVKLQVGYVPHLKHVESYYNSSFHPKDETYNYHKYENSVFRPNSDTMGLSYCKQGVPISFNNFRASSRDGYMIGMIDIIKGIDTVKTKDDILRTAEVEEFEEELERYFREELKIRVRAKAGYFNISESEMEENILEKLKRSSKLRKYLGYKTSDFDNQWSLHSGIPDIVNLEDSVVKGIIEIKKEGSDRLYKALVQGLSYAQDCGIKNVLLIAQDDELPSEIERKVQPWLKAGWTIRYEQYQKLMNL